MTNKLNLEAILTPCVLEDKIKKEFASKLELPENNQRDLLFMSAILVSTGTNKNGATFLGSELIKARDTIALKPLDIEHEEDKIIGHICSSLYLDHEGNEIDDAEYYKELQKESAATEVAQKLDKMDMDIGIVAVVYKDRFKSLAKEIEEGKWKVSMECYYEDYDIKIGDRIIPRKAVDSHFEHIMALNASEAVNLVLAGKSSGTHKVSRVLRKIRFCGVGIVENPANPRSIVLEAAKSKAEQILDREGLVEHQAAATLEVEEALAETSPLSEDNRDNEVIQLEAQGYAVVKNNVEVLLDTVHHEYSQVQEEAIRRTALAKDSGDTYTVVQFNSSFVPRKTVELDESSEVVLYKTNEIGSVKEIVTITSSKEAAGLVSRWGPNENSAGICASFKKYVYEKPGRPQPGKIVATHWCSLFDKPCPVFGASAQDPACLRNKYSRKIAYPEVHDNFGVSAPYSPTAPLVETEDLSATEQPQPEVVDMSTGLPPAPPTFASAGLVKISKLPKLLGKLTQKERAALKDSEFALPKEREWPIHTKEFLQATIDSFEDLTKKVPSFIKKKELHRNLYIAGLLQGSDITPLEGSIYFGAKAGEDFDVDYGVPRLKQFPLSTREQVLAAMSRINYIKLEISVEERQRLIINILRAAKKFNINAERFRQRVNI